MIAHLLAPDFQDILRNGALVHRRWGRWPMTGWLEEFEALGLVVRSGSGWATGEGRPTTTSG